VSLKASVNPLAANAIPSNWRGRPPRNLPAQNPVTVALTIGDNGRSANVNAKFN
jgi:hypothetical protein